MKQFLLLCTCGFKDKVESYVSAETQTIKHLRAQGKPAAHTVKCLNIAADDEHSRLPVFQAAMRS